VAERPLAMMPSLLLAMHGDFSSQNFLFRKLFLTVASIDHIPPSPFPTTNKNITS
jgi:hypothetical protein